MISPGNLRSLEDIRNKFSEDITEAMKILRRSCKHKNNIPEVFQAFDAVQKVAKDRYAARNQLGVSGAGDSLLMLMDRHRENRDIVLKCSETIKILVSCMNENKIIMGSLGVCKSMNSAMTTYQHDPEIMLSLTELMIELCNTKFSPQVLKSYLNKKRPQPSSPSRLSPARLVRFNRMESEKMKYFEDELMLDNKADFLKYGVCKNLIYSLNLILQHHRQEDIDEKIKEELGNFDFIRMSVILLKGIASLGGNDDNDLEFLKLGVCELIDGLVSFDQEEEVLLNASWVIINLCTSIKTKVKEKFASIGTIDKIFEILRTIQHHFIECTEHFNCNKVIEFLAWAALNIIQDCDANIDLIKDNSDYRIILDIYFMEDQLADYTKAKLEQLHKFFVNLALEEEPPENEENG